jgi:hypothetical protein
MLLLTLLLLTLLTVLLLTVLLLTVLLLPLWMRTMRSGGGVLAAVCLGVAEQAWVARLAVSEARLGDSGTARVEPWERQSFPLWHPLMRVSTWPLRLEAWRYWAVAPHWMWLSWRLG